MGLADGQSLRHVVKERNGLECCDDLSPLRCGSIQQGEAVPTGLTFGPMATRVGKDHLQTLDVEHLFRLALIAIVLGQYQII